MFWVTVFDVVTWTVIGKRKRHVSKMLCKNHCSTRNQQTSIEEHVWYAVGCNSRILPDAEDARKNIRAVLGNDIMFTWLLGDIFCCLSASLICEILIYVTTLFFFVFLLLVVRKLPLVLSRCIRLDDDSLRSVLSVEVPDICTVGLN